MHGTAKLFHIIITGNSEVRKFGRLWHDDKLKWKIKGVQWLNLKISIKNKDT